MKYALNLEPEASNNYFEFDAFEQEAMDSFGELDEYSDHECESCSEFDPEYDESEWEAEVMRGRRVPQRQFRTRPSMRRPRQLRPRVIRRPVQVLAGPSIFTCPAPNCPRHGSEYVRWVQSALNQIMNLRLSVTGFMNAPTRSALRSFQEKQGLPVDGIAGPETKDALLGAKGGKSPGADAIKSAEPGMMDPTEPAPTSSAKEFDFEWENFDEEFEDEFNYEFEATPAKTSSPQLSPLATAKFGLRPGSKRSIPVFGICVHTTGSGPASKARKDPRRSALTRALDYYLKGGGGFPHYVVAYDGSIIATCNERQVAWHAGFGKKDREQYKTWTAPKWWGSVWYPRGASSPLDLFPKGARSANSGHIGIEMLADATGYGFTNAQYEALAKLVADIARRHKLPITSAPSARLLGHEDVHPLSRQNKGGGWDPGAHRDKPKFSWSRLWSLLKANP
jgi:hypothetical protein